MTIPVRRLLVAEDQVDQLELWGRDIAEFNKNPDREFTFVTYEAQSDAEAIRILDEINIDCAIIDLRLPPDEDGAADAQYGNRLRTYIEKELPIPAAIHTGHVGELDDEGSNSLMKSFTKDAGKTTEALEWFAEKARLMEALASTNQRVKRETEKIYMPQCGPDGRPIKNKERSRSGWTKL